MRYLLRVKATQGVRVSADNLTPFLVYELTPDRSSAGRRDRWASRQHDHDCCEPSHRARLKAELLGCFLAGDADDACCQGAQAVQRAGDFFAVPGAHFKVDFTAKADQAALERLAKPPHKQLCGCHGEFLCELHRLFKDAESGRRPGQPDPAESPPDPAPN